MALLVLGHGIGLIALALITHRTASEMARVTLIAGLIGGGLCALWGVLGLLGHRRRAGAVLTLIPVSVVLLTQVVYGWMQPEGQAGAKAESILAPALMTVMLVASVAVLTYVVHAGEVTTETNASTPRPKSK